MFLFRRNRPRDEILTASAIRPSSPSVRRDRRTTAVFTSQQKFWRIRARGVESANLRCTSASYVPAIHGETLKHVMHANLTKSAEPRSHQGHAMRTPYPGIGTTAVRALEDAPCVQRSAPESVLPEGRGALFYRARISVSCRGRFASQTFIYAFHAARAGLCVRRRSMSGGVQHAVKRAIAYSYGDCS